MPKILSIAHRGASGYAPENTLKAVRQAVSLGADMVEIDVRSTRDGELVVFHDSLLHRKTNARGRLCKYTFPELKRVTVRGEEIPRVIEVLKIIQGACQVNLHIKERGLVEELARIVLTHEMESEVLFSSFMHLELTKLKALNPDFRVALLFSHLPSISIAIKLAKEIQAEALNLPFRRATQRYMQNMIEAAKSHDIKINIWTANHEEDIEWLKKLGVHGIITDFPDRIKN